jgi:Ca-activated chloride channel family protein
MLDRLRGDRVALVAFAGDAHEVAPLTHDRRTLSSLLDYVSPEDNRLGGTDLAAALAAAIGMFDGRSGAHEAVVLLTDGEDLEGHAAEKAEEARARGIRVYVVGIGTRAGSKIPITLPDGRQAFLRGPDGQEVLSRLEGQTLSQLARATGGDYLSAEQAATPLEELYMKRISELEGRELQSGKRRIPHDRYQWFLALAVGCMLAETGLRERSGRRGRATS